MRLTKKRAIQLTIELWEFLAETGLEKKDWDKWEQYGESGNSCYLCNYQERKNRTNFYVENCTECPYFQEFGYCATWDIAYANWIDAETKPDHKKYALKVLEELRQL